jgi:hypothetical protein
MQSYFWIKIKIENQKLFMKKAQAKVTDFLCIILLIAALAFLFSQVFPVFYEMIIKELIQSSAEVVGRQTSGLITLLGAATYDAKISYQFSDNVKYTVNIDRRTIRITPKYETKIAEETPATVTVGIELGEYNLDDVFGIRAIKTIEDGDVRYEVKAY